METVFGGGLEVLDLAGDCDRCGWEGLDEGDCAGNDFTVENGDSLSEESGFVETVQ